MTRPPPPARPRDAAATRAAILEAATRRFTTGGYEQVGMRDIAGDVGVDPALISRYFGSKEDLFAAVLAGCANGADLMRGDRAGFGDRVARDLLERPRDAQKLTGFLIMLRSIGSTKAMEIVQRSANARFHEPFAAWIEGPDAAVRARLAGGLIMGMAVSRELSGGFDMPPAQKAALRAQLADLLQRLVDG